MIKVVAFGVTTAAVSAGLASPAQAASVRPAVCDPGGSAPYYSFSNKQSVYIPARDGRVYGQSGITLTISKGVSYTVGGSVTGTASAEAGVIFAKASASLSIQVTASRTTTTTVTGSWKVPSSQPTGWLEVGTSNAYSFNWQRYHYVSPCTKVVEASGTGKAPTKSSAYIYKHS